MVLGERRGHNFLSTPLETPLEAPKESIHRRQELAPPFLALVLEFLPHGEEPITVAERVLGDAWRFKNLNVE